MKRFPHRILEGRGALLAVLAFGLALRLVNGLRGSLKLDDFHSLHHARAADASSFFRVLAEDNHPPLSFLLVKLARALFGESPFALRLPALLAGMATLVLVSTLARRLRHPRAGAIATLLVAASSLHIELSSDVRMYALLALASAGLLASLLARHEDGRGGTGVAGWTAVGLLSHYHFLYVLAALGSATLGLARCARYRARLRGTLTAFLAGGALASPWYLLVFPHQLAHGLAPGGSNATLARLAQGWKNLVFLNISVEGAGLRALGLLASGLLLGSAALGGLALVRAARRDGSPALATLLLAQAVGVPVCTWLAVKLSPRAGFEWRYLAGALPAFCLLVAAEVSASGRFARLRRAVPAFLCVAAGAFGIANALDPGEEDYRDAVQWILARAAPDDPVIAADWQPALFPHALAWDYYAARLGSGRPALERLEYDANLELLDPERLEGHERVFCCLRSLPNGASLLRQLRARFGQERVEVFGRSVYVHVFTRT